MSYREGTHICGLLQIVKLSGNLIKFCKKYTLCIIIIIKKGRQCKAERE